MDNFNISLVYLILQILYIITIIGVVVVVVSQNRNPVKTISWILVLLFLPVAGLIIYYFFGEDHRKKRLISRKMFKKLNAKALRDSLPSHFLSTPPDEYKRLVGLLRKIGDAPLYGGNNITFYSLAADMYRDLFDEIRKAKYFVHIQFYIYMDDKVGSDLRDLLFEKVKEGVEVRLMYDDVGSWEAKNSFFKKMVQGGIKIGSFLKVKLPLLTSRVNYRNHRKVVVIDGRVGFMGGMNIANRYLDGINGGIWRDCHFKLEGKAIHGLQTSFVIDWYSATNEFLSSKKYFPIIEPKGNTQMQIVTSGPTGEYKEIHQGIFQAITNAKKYVYIQTPYFIPTEDLMLAIQTAALSGVEVRLMLPEKSDTVFVHIATKSYIKDVLKSNVKVDFFKNGFIHSKLIIIDDTLTIVGSANMDVRSFEHNFEINAFVYDEKTALEAKNIYLNDLKESETTSLEIWQQRPLKDRVASSVLRLFTPLL